MCVRQRRHIVDAVTSHGGDIVLFENRQQAVFLLGNNPRKHFGALDDRLEFLVGHSRHSTTIKHLVTRLDHLEFTTNLVGCLEMIARDHPHRNARLERRADGARGFGTENVGDGDEAFELEGFASEFARDICKIHDLLPALC